MRHRTRSHLSGFYLLLEIFHRDVLPEITVHIDHHRIDTLHGIEDSRQIVVVRNLRCIFLAFQSQFLCNKLISECFPIIFGISHMVCIIISGCTAEFSSYRASLQSSQLTFQAINKNHNFLSQASWRCRLTVSFGKHRNGFPFSSIRLQLRNQFFNQRIINLLQCFLDRKRDRCIVNILRSQSKMNKLFVLFQSTQLIKLFFQEILYGFHIMVSHTFNILDTLRIGFRKITVDIAQ